jgi:hypothetical protein
MIDWTQIIIKAYWPVVVIVLFVLFKENISSIFYEHPSFGKFLVELNEKKKVFTNKEYIKSIAKLDTSDFWFLSDFKREGTSILDINKMNPVQKFVYNKLKSSVFIKTDGNKVTLTDDGKKILDLAINQ